MTASNATGAGATSTVANVTTILASPAGFGVTASASVPTEIDLAWTATTHATGYKIERSLNQVLWTTITPATPLAGTDHAYADTSALAGTTYFYRISAIDAVGTSAPTSAATALTIPVTPTLNETVTSATTINFVWNTVTGAATYLLEKSIDTGTHWTTAVSQTSTTFTDTGLTADTTYEYRLSAVDATGRIRHQHAGHAHDNPRLARKLHGDRVRDRADGNRPCLDGHGARHRLQDRALGRQ